jgi:hypothetical protein
MVKPKLRTVWALAGAAAGALVGFLLAAVYVEHILPGQLTGHSPDSDAGFVLVMLGGFLAMLGAGAGAPWPSTSTADPRTAPSATARRQGGAG